MAGLAGYVENGALSAEGIECACAGLMKFRGILNTLGIENVRVFATASLRNISNTRQALSVIEAATGFTIEVISGEEEALLGYTGAMLELHISGGAFIDVGGEGSLKRLHGEIKKNIGGRDERLGSRPLVIGVGGTARAAMNLARHYYGISGDCRSMTSGQLDGLCDFLCGGTKEASDLILRLEADRVHTIVPGLMIHRHVFHIFHAEQLVVSGYGVREGYLCKRILMSDTSSHKTAN